MHARIPQREPSSHAHSRENLATHTQDGGDGAESVPWRSSGAYYDNNNNNNNVVNGKLRAEEEEESYVTVLPLVGLGLLRPSS